ncbi:hypothetical protein IWZ01DRAFT_192458 [Phyllosticta capitalensis]
MRAVVEWLWLWLWSRAASPRYISASSGPPPPTPTLPYCLYVRGHLAVATRLENAAFVSLFLTTKSVNANWSTWHYGDYWPCHLRFVRTSDRRSTWKHRR